MHEQASPKLSRRPFLSAPNAACYFPAEVVEEARQRIMRSIDRGAGPAIVIGAAGTGKSMLLEVLAQRFSEQMPVAILRGAQLCTRRALLQMLLFQLELPYRGLDEGELRLSIHAFLAPRDGPARRILVVVDEADALPTRLLEELRVLTNQTQQGATLVNLVLAGSSILEERLAEPELEVFSQRVSARSYLAPLGREETFQYIRAQIAAVDGDPDRMFTAEAFEAMFAVTDGIPRLINQLGDQLLWMAAESGCQSIEADLVQQAWSELQQLPAPWETPAVEPDQALDSGCVVSSGSVVEFGDLSAGEPSVGEVRNNELSQGLSEEDPPAAIPIDVSVDASFSMLDATKKVSDTFFVAEQASSVIDPFDEPFESEEVIFDRYAKLEELLIFAAPRVVNQSDTAFASDLVQSGVHSGVQPAVSAGWASPDPLGEIASPTPEPFCPWDSVDQLYQQDDNASSPTPFIAAFSPSEPVADDTPPEEIQLLTEAAETQPAEEVVQAIDRADPGELLVVEEDGSADSTIVTSRNLRRLFSCLESGQPLSRVS